ncbi:MAG: ABC transporter permease [Candidatus Nanosyncoccaceae bacterium]|jgi:ABC-2 type transport system permease protein
MFWQVFKNRLKITLRDRETLFWLFGFMFIMAMLFNSAFSGLNDSIQFDPVQVAVVENADYQAESSLGLRQAINGLSNSDPKILDVMSVESRDQAIQRLTNKDVVAVISVKDNQIKVEVLKNGSYESLVKVAMDQSLQTSHAVIEVVQSNPKLLFTGHLAKIGQTDYIKPEADEVDHTAIYFYSLIGMSCIMAGSLGLMAVNQGEANLSHLGKRLSASPASKGVVLMANLAAGYVVSVTAQILLFLFLSKVLHVSFGPQSWAIFLTMLIGPMAGLALGTLIGSSSQKDDKFKTGVLVSVTMMGSLLAGMMGSQILKHQIDRHIPILGIINPVNTVSDALFSVYYFGVGQRYWLNLVYVAGFTTVAMFISWLFLRRKRYASL